jgi:hypothetical protein
VAKSPSAFSARSQSDGFSGVHGGRLGSKKALVIIAFTWARAASRRSITPSVSSATKVSARRSIALDSSSSSTALEMSAEKIHALVPKLSSRCFCTRSQSIDKVTW